MPENDTYLEQLLLTQTIATDPDLALRKAEAMLDRGEYSVTIVSVLEKLQDQNKPGAARLTEKILGRLQPDTLLSSYGAISLALGILRSEPRPSESLPGSLIAGISWSQRGRLPAVAGNRGRGSAQSDAEATGNARDLLLNLRSLLPQIEQYSPARAQAVRQKISELYDQTRHARAWTN